MEFTYGEFALPFFADLLDHATAASAVVSAQDNVRSQAEFVDLGRWCGEAGACGRCNGALFQGSFLIVLGSFAVFLSVMGFFCR